MILSVHAEAERATDGSFRGLVLIQYETQTRTGSRVEIADSARDLVELDTVMRPDLEAFVARMGEGAERVPRAWAQALAKLDGEISRRRS